jgi:hypothetical protein
LIQSWDENRKEILFIEDHDKREGITLLIKTLTPGPLSSPLESNFKRAVPPQILTLMQERQRLQENPRDGA